MSLEVNRLQTTQNTIRTEKTETQVVGVSWLFLRPVTYNSHIQSVNSNYKPRIYRERERMTARWWEWEETHTHTHIQKRQPIGTEMANILCSFLPPSNGTYGNIYFRHTSVWIS